MSLILGIDPGATGAMVTWSPETNVIVECVDNGEWCMHEDPAKELNRIITILRISNPRPDIVVIEAQHSRPARGRDGKVLQGGASMWKYAEHYGIILGCLASMGVPVYRVDPAVWKATMHVTSDKETPLVLARELWPQSAAMFKMKKWHGRAEAALLAVYAKRFLPLPQRREL